MHSDGRGIVGAVGAVARDRRGLAWFSRILVPEVRNHLAGLVRVSVRISARILISSRLAEIASVAGSESLCSAKKQKAVNASEGQEHHIGQHRHRPALPRRS